MPITIGIPFYNAEIYLLDALRSVFAQTYQDWELILVDDGSTDQSLEIALSVNDPRVRVISDGQNKKLPFRLNQITSEANYELIGRMDADDLISPTRFERQVKVLESHPEVDLVTTGVCSITSANIPVGVRCGASDDSITGRKLLLGQNAVVHAAVLGRRSWFLRNPYDPSLPRAQDHELWLRAFSKSDFNCFVMEAPLYYYREEENVTSERLMSAYECHRFLYSKYGYLGFNRHEIRLLIAKTYMKSLTVNLLSRLGRMDMLLNRRNRPITETSLLSDFNLEINQILATKIPGID
jgi:glycosyltransferase involved in cell wall biosynthesis